MQILSYRNFTWLLFCIIPFYGFSQTTNPSFTIKQCVKYAIENHGNMKISRFDEYISEKEVDKLLAVAYPQINASINLQSNIQVPQFIFSLNPALPPQKVKAGQPQQNVAGAQLSQLIFDGTFFLGLQASKEYVNLAKLNTQRTENDLINQVVTAYYGALTAREGGALIDLNLERLQNLYKDTDAMYRNGLVEKNDVDRIQLSINNLLTEKAKFERMKALTINVLKFQMGMPIETNLTLSENLPEVAPDKDNLTLYETQDFSKRIEFTVMKQQEVLANYNIRRFKVAYLPSIYGFAFYQYNMQSYKYITFEENSTFQTSGVGLKVSIPIFDGFRNKAEIQQAKIALQKIAIGKEMLENGLKMEMENTLTTLRNSKDTYTSQKENVALAKRIYDTAKLKYKEGVGSSLEVNNAEVAVKEAERNLLGAQLDYLNARLKIWQTKGELKERFGE